MAKIRLTKRTIEGLVPAERPVYVWDTEAKGLAVRVYPSGRKVFHVFYRTEANQQRWHKIGDSDAVALDQARKMARAVLAEVAAGHDPAQQRADGRREITLGAFSERYMVEYAQRHKKPSTVRNNWTLLRAHILPAFGNRRLSALRHAEVQRFHDAIEGPHQANAAIRVLRHIYTIAERWGVFEGANPAGKIQMNREQARRRYMSAAELQRLADAMRAMEREQLAAPSMVALLRFLILCGCRKGEAMSLQWGHIDFANRRADLPDSKTGSKSLYLNQAAMVLLDALPRSGPYVFPSPRNPAEPIRELKTLWARLLKRADIADLRIHDLRHSFASLAVCGGASLPLVGGLLGHTQPSTTGRYAHLSNDPLLAVADMVGQKIMDIIEGARIVDADHREPIAKEADR